MHGARHGFRDSGARLASSPPAPPPPPPSPTAFYYYWADITQAPLIIHQQVSAKSQAEETRHPAAWKESRLRLPHVLWSCVQGEPWALITNYLHKDGVCWGKKGKKKMSSSMQVRHHHPCAPCSYKWPSPTQNTLKEMSLFSYTDAHHERG